MHEPVITVTQQPDGRYVERVEIVGQEGGPPPVVIEWNDAVTGEPLGFYSCDSGFHIIKTGPMFDG